eukprot:m.96158 g.96158  ORF g.96158 m.96158 type:complete len:438 (-) comp15478_c1_seq1:52-1365(-)
MAPFEGNLLLGGGDHAVLTLMHKKLVLGGFGLLGRRLGVGSSGTSSSSSALLALLLGAGLLGVLLLALGTDGDGQQLLELLAQESLLRLVDLRVECAVGDAERAVAHQQHKHLELRNKDALSLPEDVKGLQDEVADALGHAELGLVLLLEHAQGEGHVVEALVDLADEGAGGLHLQLVLVVGLLEDGGALLAGLDLAVAGAHKDVQSVHLVDLEGGVLVVLLVLLRRVGDDGLGTVNDVLRQLVREHALDRRAGKVRANRVQRSGDGGSAGPRLDHAQGDLERVVSSGNHVGLGAGHGLLLGGANDYGCGDGGNVAVNVHAEVDLDDVALLKEHLRVRVQRRVVADAVVQRHAGGEGNALRGDDALDLLVVDGGDLLEDGLVAELAERQHRRANLDAVNDELEHAVAHLAGQLVLGDDVSILQTRLGPVKLVFGRHG